jgi:O-antigen ligase
MAAVLAVALLIAFALGFLNPFAGLIGLLGINVIQPGELYPVFNTFHVERLAAIVVLISLLLQRGRISFKAPLSRQVLYFWLALFASVPLAYWRTNSFIGAIGFYRIVVYFFLIINLVDTLPRLRFLITVFVALNGWLAVSSYWAYSHGDYYVSSTFGRAEGLTSSGGDPNSLGTSLVCGLPFAALLLFYGNMKLRILALATIGMSLFTLVLTGSRTSFFGFVALLIVFAVTRRNKIFILPVAILVVAGIFFIAPQQYQQRYLSVEQRNQDESYTNRVLAWKAGLAMMEHNPLTGIGMHNFADANGAKYWPAPGRKHWLQPHSLYIQVGAELGIVGIAAFFWFLWSLYNLNRSIKKKSAMLANCPKWLRQYATACNFSLFVLLFTGYTSHSLYRSTWFLLAAMTACAYRLIQREAADKTETTPAKLDRLPVETEHWATVRAGVTS